MYLFQVAFNVCPVFLPVFCILDRSDLSENVEFQVFGNVNVFIFRDDAK